MTAGHEPVPLTPQGYARLHAELQRLKSEERPQIIAAIAEARAHGDLKENAEYHSAREKQGFIEGRIAFLEDRLGRAQVVEMEGESFDTIRFGAWVHLEDEGSGEEKIYRLVGDLEADIDQNLLSVGSPMGRALLGKSVDDAVAIRVPRGTREYVITQIRYEG